MSDYLKAFSKKYESGKFKIITLDTTDEIEEDSIFLIIDMQNDFVNPEGSFPVRGAETIVDMHVELITLFAIKGKKIMVSHDSHPDDSCSFTTQNGPFPPHCVQGTKGAEIVPKIADALDSCKLLGTEVVNIWKGFDPDMDSYSAGAPYTEETAKAYGITMRDVKKDYTKWPGGCRCGSSGGFVLKSSGGKTNSQPDIASILSPTPMVDYLKKHGIKTVYMMGVATDFCVAQSAFSLAADFNVKVILNACRAVKIPDGKYCFNSGFGYLNNPADLAEAFQKKNIAVVLYEPTSPLKSVFPLKWELHVSVVPPVDGLTIYSGNKYTQNKDGETEKYIYLDYIDQDHNIKFSVDLKRSPFGDLKLSKQERKNALIPNNAQKFAFVYPSKDIKKIKQDKETFKYLPKMVKTLLEVGFYVYLSDTRKIVGVHTFSEGNGMCSYSMQDMSITPDDVVKKLISSDRFEEVTLQSLKSKNATKFCCINPGEFHNLCPNGGFCYQFEPKGKAPFQIHYNRKPNFDS